MRHLLLFICCTIVSVISFAQNRELQRIVLNDGTIINGQVEKQTDGTIMVSTDNGDIFFFQPSEVNRVIGANQLLTAESQTGNIDSTVKRKGNKLYYAKSGMALTKDDYYSPEAWEEYQTIVKRGKTSRILLASGVGAVSFGFVGMFIAGQISGNGENSGVAPTVGITSFAITVAGLGVGVTGLFLTISSNNKLNRLANSYNQNSAVKLSLGIQQSGVGLALAF